MSPLNHMKLVLVSNNPNPKRSRKKFRAALRLIVCRKIQKVA